MAFNFKTTKKDTFMTEEDEECYKNENICRYCEKQKKSDKVKTFVT